MKSKALEIDLPESYSRFYMDFVSGRISGLDPAHGAFRDTGLWKSLAETAISKCRGTPGFWKEFEDHNARLGGSEKAIKNVRSLAAGNCVAVLGGQQPSLLGGSLLVLYKAATIIALAERFKSVTGVPCAPVFIVSGDDSDFTETSGCTLFDGSLRRLSAAFSQEGYRSGQMVGTLPVAEEKELGDSLLASVGDLRGKAFVEDLLAGASGVARDHGEFVGALMSRLFSGRGLLVLEGRSLEMRRSGRELFGAYLAKREELAVAVRAKGKELESRGYHAQISGPGLDWWLFKIEDGLRKKSGEGGADALKRGLAEAPESISPNVALRPLWRDSTFPAVLDVLGPSEVAYTVQLTDAYKTLEVSPRGLFPRLSMTLVPPEGEIVAGGWGEEQLSGLLNDFENLVRTHYARLIPPDAKKALSMSRSALGDSLRELGRTLGELSPKWGKAAESVGHAGEKGLSKLEDEIVESLKRDAQKDNPRLKGLGDFLRPAGKMQERTVSALYPLLERGEPFLEDLAVLAATHVGECVSGRVRHYCYGLGGGGD
jgi:bacillithiol biosynthesis cysteine-adding enzyme BshC